MCSSEKYFFLEVLQEKINTSEKNTPVCLVLVNPVVINTETVLYDMKDLIQKLATSLISQNDGVCYRISEDKFGIIISKKNSFQVHDIALNFCKQFKKDNNYRSFKKDCNAINIGITCTVSNKVDATTLFTQAKNALSRSIIYKEKRVICHKDIVFMNSKPGIKKEKYHFHIN
ncbi:diguanylate cyclase [Citrobacter amalonaticus]|nr:diguanylate cyclase [Citrobacter amalonaticus]